ncbi:fungal-specific transcription factor domain-containing protein [Pilobolus umbonatus]|nr:fungal-specific transcription factor domain-containing protein [Pilobolus umbonatus]
MERRLMGPPMYNSHEHSLSPSLKAHSPIQLYENPERSSDLPPLDLVNHLVDLFFTYVNSVFPFVHRAVLKKSIQDGTVSRPLLYAVLAISARFSEHPSIRTQPPYLAGECYANKALSLVDVSTLEPNLANIQFWGIMSCLEYGRASGSKAWIYGGLAVRFCQELGYYKEETMSVPILAEDGSIDTIAMALRRRVYWSCLCIDKLCCAGTHRPQSIEKTDCDTNPTNISECLLLRDPTFHRNVDDKSISDDSLMNIAKYYMRCVEAYGEVNKYMNRAKSSTASIVWPPIAEFRNLDMLLRSWRDGLPDKFQFNQTNLSHHRVYASRNYLSVWLSCHAIWCSSMMILHRGSLAYADIKMTEISDDLYRRIQKSIDTCRACVDDAMGIFEAIKDLCGINTLPYIGYSAYVFATVLMTSAFSSTSEDCKKSNKGLRMLFDLINALKPYWPMCDRLANATKDLLTAHQRLYESTRENGYYNDISTPYSVNSFSHSPIIQSPIIQSPNNIRSPSLQSPSMQSPSIQSTKGLISTGRNETSLSALLASDNGNYSYKNDPEYYIPSPTTSSVPETPVLPSNALSDQSSALLSTYSNINRGNEINFNSLEFLYDTGLFGHVVFDGSAPMNDNASLYQARSTLPAYPVLPVSIGASQPTAYSSLLSSSYNDPIQSSPSQPTMPSKSLWN